MCRSTRGVNGCTRHAETKGWGLFRQRGIVTDDEVVTANTPTIATPASERGAILPGVVFWGANLSGAIGCRTKADAGIAASGCQHAVPCWSRPSAPPSRIATNRDRPIR